MEIPDPLDMFLAMRFLMILIFVRTCLKMLLLTGHLDSTLFLLDRGANIKLIDVNGYNALELAILANKKEVAMGIIK